MSPSTLPDHPRTYTPDEQLHLCLLDRSGQVRASNYPLNGNSALPLPALIRLAYGVDPHPDMPDGVYQRMESQLASHAGSAGYYLCRSRNDKPFWISVSFYNTPNGRVICHFPVTSAKLLHFSRLFAQLKTAEQAGLTLEESAAQLNLLMISEGIKDYRALAISIIIEEIAKRDTGRNRQQYQSILVLDAILTTLRDIEENGKRIDKMSARSKLIPYQLQLQAARLEGTRGPLSMIADNHQELTLTLLGVTTELQSASATEIEAVIDTIAYLAQSSLAAELLETDQVKCCETDQGAQATRAELDEVIVDCGRQIMALLDNIGKSVSKLSKICHRMRRSLSAMETTRMMCKIERSRLSSKAEGLMDIENQLHDVQVNLSKWMGEIGTSATEAMRLVEGLKNATARVAA